MTLKHADGTEWVLVPKLATEEMIATHGWGAHRDKNFVTVQGKFQRETWGAMLATTPAFTPSDEMVERAAAAMFYAEGYVCPWDELGNSRLAEQHRRSALAVLRALGIGGEGE